MDSDLAKLYGYSVKAFNQQVQRNIERFPNDFMWKLTKEECDELSRSQIVTLNTANKRGQNIKYLPYVFTEQGIYALSGVLKGPLATAVSIKLIRAFKELKDFYNENRYLLDKVIDIENKQIEYKKDSDKKFNEVFDFISSHSEIKEKIYFEGQIYEAFSFIVDVIKKAKNSIILIDNYVNIDTLNILAKKNSGVDVTIYTSSKHKILTQTDINLFNKEYPSLTVKYTNAYHDRFLIIDNNDLYHVGHSIKDAGKKGFGIIKLEDKKLIKEILNNL